VEAQAVPPLQPSLRPTERGGVGGGGAAAVRHEVEGGRRRGWRAGEGGGGRRDEQSLLSMLGRTASIFFFADVVGRRPSGHCYIEMGADFVALWAVAGSPDS